jgi:hypothetical protein
MLMIRSQPKAQPAAAAAAAAPAASTSTSAAPEAAPAPATAPATAEPTSAAAPEAPAAAAPTSEAAAPATSEPVESGFGGGSFGESLSHAGSYQLRVPWPGIVLMTQYRDLHCRLRSTVWSRWVSSGNRQVFTRNLNSRHWALPESIGD